MGSALSGCSAPLCPGFVKPDGFPLLMEMNTLENSLVNKVSNSLSDVVVSNSSHENTVTNSSADVVISSSSPKEDKVNNESESVSEKEFNPNVEEKKENNLSNDKLDKIILLLEALVHKEEAAICYKP